MQLFLIIRVLVFVAAVMVKAIQLPSLTGQYPVGIVNLELIDDSRMDPLAPSPESRDLMVSVYYPTTEAAVRSNDYRVAPYVTPTVAAALSMFIGTSEEIQRVVTQAYSRAPIRSSDFPVLIFSPGLAATRIMYTTLLEDLASHGWIVISVDHTYDALMVEFPDGRKISRSPTLLDGLSAKVSNLIDIRVADIKFVSKALRDPAVLSQIPGLTKSDGITHSLRTDHMGVFGHSLGRATAAQVVSNSSAFTCGASIDGGIFGPVLQSGLSKSFLQIEAQNHNSSDATASGFYSRLSGFHRRFTVNGTVHISFDDFPVLRDLLGDKIPRTDNALTQFGIVEGNRVMEVETTLLDAFFSFCLKEGSVDLLDGLARGRFPEVFVP